MQEQNKVAILGASRGLGAALTQIALKNTPEGNLFLSSRKFELLRKLGRDNDTVVPADFTNSDDQMLVLKSLESFLPTQIFYVAGGGPHGEYGKKNWKDHQWALELNLLFPARLLHFVFNSRPVRENLKQLVFVGSAIAEQKPDPLASSYAAAKHGLRGLVSSVAAEKPGFDLRIYSPGYMDTDLLPQGAWPRLNALVASAPDEASKLWQWSLNPLD